MKLSNSALFLFVAISAIATLGTTACGDGGSVAVGSTRISAIQGSGTESPFDGQTVVISAVVTGDFQDGDADTSSNLGGFYIQQETDDGDAGTSEGLFIFDGDSPKTDVDIGDRVEVTGMIKEHFEETQLDAKSVRVTGNGTIAVTDVTFPTIKSALNSDGDDIADLERYEGMLVRFPQEMTASSLRALERFGEVRLSQGGRPFQFTNNNPPDVGVYAEHATAYGARSVILDDGLRKNNPADIRYLTAGNTNDYSIRVGDTVSGVTGNLRYSRGSGGRGDENWRLMPIRNPVFQNDNPRPGAPTLNGSVRIASFNVLNFFSRIDNGKPRCGPDAAQNCRGADSDEELARQLQKTTVALEMMSADVIGLMELENNESESIATIVDALNERVGEDTYRYVDTGTIDTDTIKTGFIYDATTIRAAGPSALLTSAVDPRFNSSKNRPALAQSFEVLKTGAIVTVVVNHLKSKGSSCETIGDANTNDGQGNCNMTRTSGASAIADWLGTDPTGSGDDDFLIIGDLNAYILEDPLTALKDAGYSNLLELESDPYSFVFDGKSGALDHALASPSLLDQVSAVVEWHINADEPPLLDYNLDHGRAAGLFDPNSPYRASDHDPVIVGLDLTN